MSERKPDYDMAIVLAILICMILFICLGLDGLMQHGEIRDLQRRVGQLEEGVKR